LKLILEEFLDLFWLALGVLDDFAFDLPVEVLIAVLIQKKRVRANNRNKNNVASVTFVLMMIYQ
jgi:hypothetical protein